MSDEKKKKKLSDLPLRLSSEIVGNEVIPIVYLGEAYRLTLDELKTFIGVISGGSVDLTKVGSHVLPKATNTYDVGNAALHWRSLYAGSVNANTIYLGNTGFSLREADDKLHLTFGSNLTEYVATESDVKALLAQLEGKADSLSVLELSQRVGSVESKANSNASKINTLSAEATTTAKGLMSAADKRLLDKLGVFYESTDSDDVINKWKELEKFLEGLKETDSLATITAELQGQIDGLWGRNSFDDLFAGHAAADTMAVGELTVDKINGGTPVTSAVLGSHLGYINGALDVLDYVSMADVNKQVSDVKSWVGTNYATGASVVTLEGRMTSFEENYVHNDFFKSYTDRIEQNEKDIAGLESNYDGFMQEFVDVARDLETRKADKSSLSNYYTKSELHNVATTGDYNDLINKPEIPSLDDVLKKNDSALVGTGLEWAAGCLRVDGDIINNASDGYTAYSWGNHASAGYAKSSELGSFAKKNSLAASDIPDLSGTYQTKITSTNKLSSSLVSGLGAASGYGVSQNDFTASDGNLVVGAAVYSHVTNRLKGYATQSWVEDKKYLTGITSAQVTNALGYTPYNSTNPSGYYKSGDSPTFNTITLNGATLTLGTGVTLNDKNLAVAGSISEGGTLLSNKYQPIGNYQPAGDYLTSANIGTAINNAIANYGFATVATSGSYNDLTNKPFIPNIDTLINDGLATRYDVAEVNAKFANYLPLSGGAISGEAGALRIIRGGGDYASTIKFENSIKELGHLGISNSGDAILLDANGSNQKTLIHSGNIGSQSVNNALNLGGTPASHYATLGSSLSHYGILDAVPSYSVVGANYSGGNWLGYTYATEEHGGYVAGGVISAGTPSSGFQLNGSPNTDELYFRGRIYGKWGGWSQVAFTDSTVAAANSLVNVNGTPAISTSSFDTVNISGTVSITRSNADSTDVDQYGNIKFKTLSSVGVKDWSIQASNNGKLLVFKNTGQLLIGGANYTGDERLYVDGSVKVSESLYVNQMIESSYLRISTSIEVGKSISIGGDSVATVPYVDGLVSGLWSRNSFDELYATHVMSDTLAVEEMFTDKLTIGNAPIEYVVHEGLKLSTAIYIDGYSVALSNQLPTTTQKNNWNTAYGWGNHASAGYASFKNVDGHTFIKLSGGIESEDSWALRIGTDYFNGSTQYAVYANYGSGNVHLGTPNYRWNTVYAVTVNQSSDATLKDVIGDTSLTLSQIANAPAVSFTWKYNGKKDVGTLAQYWKDVLPEIVSGEEGSMGINYATLGVVSAIILARNVETHEQRISRLERENEELRKEILTLKNR